MSMSMSNGNPLSFNLVKSAFVHGNLNLSGLTKQSGDSNSTYT